MLSLNYYTSYLHSVIYEYYLTDRELDIEKAISMVQASHMMINSNQGWGTQINEDAYKAISLSFSIEENVKDDLVNQAQISYNEPYESNGILTLHQSETSSWQDETSEGFGVKAWFIDMLGWSNEKIDPYLQQVLGINNYGELQRIADQYEANIKIKDQKTARQAFRRIALKVHQDRYIKLSSKAEDGDPEAKIEVERIENDFFTAEELSNDNPTSMTDIEIYTPVILKLENIHKGIRVIDSVIDTIKVIRDPNEGNILKAMMGYMYIGESVFGKSLGIKYLVPINIVQQVYQGNYEGAIKSSITAVGYMLPGMLMPVAPALAVTLKAGFIAYAAYDTSIELYNALSGDIPIAPEESYLMI